MPVFEKIQSSEPESGPFLQPVNPEILGIPVCIFLSTNLNINAGYHLWMSVPSYAHLPQGMSDSNIQFAV